MARRISNEAQQKERQIAMMKWPFSAPLSDSFSGLSFGAFSAMFSAAPFITFAEASSMTTPRSALLESSFFESSFFGRSLIFWVDICIHHYPNLFMLFRYI